jgi:ketosteroid isomerase-like protein
MNVDGLIRFYHQLSPDSLAGLAAFYAPDARFKDPFNEVRGIAAIQHIFEHMFDQLDAPRFRVVDQVVDGQAAVLVWEFHFRFRRWGRSQARLIRGVSHLRFAADGKVDDHRDYWDTGEELYMKLPGLGMLLRGLRRLLAA